VCVAQRRRGEGCSGRRSCVGTRGGGGGGGGGGERAAGARTEGGWGRGDPRREEVYSYVYIYIYMLVSPLYYKPSVNIKLCVSNYSIHIYTEEEENERRARVEKAAGEEAMRDAGRFEHICTHIDFIIELCWIWIYSIHVYTEEKENGRRTRFEKAVGKETMRKARRSKVMCISGEWLVLTLDPMYMYEYIVI